MVTTQSFVWCLCLEAWKKWRWQCHRSGVCSKRRGTQSVYSVGTNEVLHSWECWMRFFGWTWILSAFLEILGWNASFHATILLVKLVREARDSVELHIPKDAKGQKLLTLIQDRSLGFNQQILVMLGCQRSAYVDWNNFMQACKCSFVDVCARDSFWVYVGRWCMAGTFQGCRASWRWKSSLTSRRSAQLAVPQQIGWR